MSIKTKNKVLNINFIKSFLLWIVFLFSIAGCGNESKNESAKISTDRIVSLNGTITEVLCELGLEKNIVGVDITSNYPESMLGLPKAGHNRNINTEAVLTMQPSVIFAFEGGLKKETIEQFYSAKVPVILLKQEYSVEGIKNLVKQVADTLHLQNKVDVVYRKLEANMNLIPVYNTRPKVLFVYARGAGSMSVCGRNTAIDKMIELAGGENAAGDLEDFKPYTSEALVQRNPDVLLFFDDGLKSLNGLDGLLKMPGVSQTNAGRNGKIVTMEGQLLAGFSPRLGIAVTQLSRLIHE